jgi:hypothetical protein
VKPLSRYSYTKTSEAGLRYRASRHFGILPIAARTPTSLLTPQPAPQAVVVGHLKRRSAQPTGLDGLGVFIIEPVGIICQKNPAEYDALVVAL